LRTQKTRGATSRGGPRTATCGRRLSRARLPCKSPEPMPNLRVHDRCGCGAARGEHAFGSARPFAFAGTPRNFERDRPFVIEHLAADIVLDVPKKSIRAAAALTVRRVDATATEIDLDAVGFTIDKVLVDGKPAEYRYDGRVLVVS